MTDKKRKLNYPQDFIERAKDAFPNNQRLHEALDSGDTEAGILLSDASMIGHGIFTEWTLMYGNWLQEVES